MKKLRLLLRACVALVGLSACVVSVKAQTPIVSWTYSPNSFAQMEGNRWNGYSFPANTKLWANIWAPWNTTGTRIDAAGWPMPMRMWTNIYDNTQQSWSVTYDLVGEMAKNSPYRNPDPKIGYGWVKAYPSIQYKPTNLYVYDGNAKYFRSDWTFNAVSTDWGKNRFNAIWEIRLVRYDNSGNPVPNSDYIIQLEVMQADYGSPAPANVALSNYNWTPGSFITYNNTPVYKFILSGAGVTRNTSNTLYIDFFEFLRYTANNRATYPRADWNAKVTEVNAGVEVCEGTNSKFSTTKYGIGDWNR